jgi:hypothetical protein
MPLDRRVTLFNLSAGGQRVKGKAIRAEFFWADSDISMPFNYIGYIYTPFGFNNQTGCCNPHIPGEKNSDYTRLEWGREVQFVKKTGKNLYNAFELKGFFAFF